MHADILHLAERLVIAMESMSQNMKNMSAYVHDLSHNVSYFLNKERDKGDISQRSFDESAHVPSGSPAAGQTPPESGNIWQNKQPSGSSFSHVAELEHQTTPAGDVASPGIDCSENADGFSIVSNGRVCSEEINRHDTMEMSFQEKFLKMPCSSESGTVLFQNLMHQKPYVFASCSAADDTMGREGGAGMCFSEGHVEEEVEHVGERKYTDQSGSVRARGSDVTHAASGSFSQSVRCSEVTQFEKRTEESALSDSLSERSENKGRKMAVKCSICLKTFSWKSQLINHMRIHTGEKPFKCNICGKSFRTSSNKTQHMCIHTAEKNFTCNLCGMEFRRSGYLTMHERSHTK